MNRTVPIFLGCIFLASCLTVRTPDSCPHITAAVTGFYKPPTGIVRTELYFRLTNNSDRPVRITKYLLSWRGDRMSFSPAGLIVAPKGSISWSASYEARPQRTGLPEIRVTGCSHGGE